MGFSVGAGVDVGAEVGSGALVTTPVGVAETVVFWADLVDSVVAFDNCRAVELHPVVTMRNTIKPISKRLPRMCGTCAIPQLHALLEGACLASLNYWSRVRS